MRFLGIVTTVSLLLAPRAVVAQEAVDPNPPAHVSLVDGTAFIERDGTIDSSPANMPLLAGDRVRTETGRVEILFADGSTLHLDNFTKLDFQSDEIVRILDGRVRLTISGRGGDVGYRIDGPGAWAQISQPGEYRVSLTRGDRGLEMELAVLRGAAELVNDDGRTALRAGERAFARTGVAPSYAYVFNSAAWDAFDRWSEARRDHRLGLSSQYLPEPVRAYSRDFDTYGSWRHEPTYGYVWYPTVAVNWRPYYHGRWATLRPYGWFWVGNDPWAWPTHHYGRWGFSGSWFWIPGRTWGPAWVSWAYSPGYVSWCPLGWNNRPAFHFANGYYARGYDHWRGWTIVPRHHFGRDFVHRRVVSVHHLDARARGSWEFRDSAPEIRGHAVPRSTAPIRVAGRAVPRGGGMSAPIYTNRSLENSRVQSNGPRIQVTDRPGGDIERDGRSRAVPRAEGTDVQRLTPERGVRSAPILRSGVAADPSNSSRPGTSDRDPVLRAVPRGGAGDAGRVAPDRGSRSVPAIRPGTGGGGENPSGLRAVPRQSGGTDERAPARPDNNAYSPYSRGAPLPQQGPADSGASRPEPQRVPGMRAIPRAGSGDGGWSGPSRMPSERRGPDGPADGGRAAPRSAPQDHPSAPSGMERRAPPQRSTDAPSRPAPDRSAAPARSRAGGGGRGGR
jgi:FecR protein